MLELPSEATDLPRARAVLDGGELLAEDHAVLGQAVDLAVRARAAVARHPGRAAVLAEVDAQVLATATALSPVRQWSRDAFEHAQAGNAHGAELSVWLLVSSARGEAAVGLSAVRRALEDAAAQGVTRDALHAGNALSGRESRTLAQAGLITDDVDYPISSQDRRIDTGLRSARSRHGRWAVAMPPERGLGRDELADVDEVARVERREREAAGSSGRDAAQLGCWTTAGLLVLAGGSVLLVAAVIVGWIVQWLLPSGSAVPQLVPLTIGASIPVLLLAGIGASGRLGRSTGATRRSLTGPAVGASTDELAARAVEAGLRLRHSQVVDEQDELWGLQSDQVHTRVWDVCRTALVLDRAGTAPADALVHQTRAQLEAAVIALEVAADQVSRSFGTAPELPAGQVRAPRTRAAQLPPTTSPRTVEQRDRARRNRKRGQP